MSPVADPVIVGCTAGAAPAARGGGGGVVTGGNGASLDSTLWNAICVIVCGSLSSVTMKSLAVSPSIGFPCLSRTVTSTTLSRAPLLKTGGVGGCVVCCAEPSIDQRATVPASTRTDQDVKRVTR